jgi:acetate kinase
MTLLTSRHILCLNSGSSSLKWSLYRLSETEETLLLKGAVEHIGQSEGRLWLRHESETPVVDTAGDFPTHRDAVRAMFDTLHSQELPSFDVVGHRIVHGGPDHLLPEPLDDTLLAALRSCIPLAPLHLPSEISVIEAVRAHFPRLLQVICFDTAFHRRMPETAQRLPLPRSLWNEGVRRYGFHGLSYEYIMSVLAEAARGRVIIAHLGNGASLAAVQDGQPRETTMGFTPAGGFMMGTRSGDLDPGIVFYLARQQGYDMQRLEAMILRESGLLGVSELSADMHILLEQRQGKPHAAQAVEMFCYQVRKQIGALTAVLGGLDTLVFTGGIGERAAPVRWEICQGLDHLGIALDAERNRVHDDRIMAAHSRCAVRVIPTREDLVIARHVWKRTVRAAKEATA